MSARTAITRHVLAPVFDRMRGTATMQRLAHLERSQWWSQERIVEQQSAHVRALVAHAYAHVPYYHKRMNEHGLQPADIRTVEDLRRLPPLTKADAREHFSQLLSDAVPPGQLWAGWSGGTTGERLHFYSTRRERLTYAYARWALTLGWTGVQLGEPHVSIRQHSSERRRSALSRLSLRLQQLTKIDTMTVDEENLDAIVRTLQRTKPRALFSYPSALALIASHAKAAGMDCPHIHAMCLGGEQLTERQRVVLEEVFSSTPYVRYGSNELYEVSGQCEVRGGLHILAEDFIIEVVDDSGAPVPTGERGRLLITALHNYGMPFIRYEPGDIGALENAICPCGRGLPLMNQRVGRSREYLHSATGSRVAAADIDIGHLLPPGVVQYQLIQKTIDRFVLKLVPIDGAETYTLQAATRSVEAVIRARLGSNADVELELVPRIDMNLSGKRLAFISQVDPVGMSPEPSRP